MFNIALRNIGTHVEQHFEEFLTGIDAANSDDEAWDALCRSISNLGFDKAIYLYYPDATDSSMGEPLHRTTYADDWMDYWNSEGYNEVDIPVRRTIEAGYKPMIMDVGEYLDNPAVSEDAFAMQALSDAKDEGGCSKVYSHQLYHGTVGLGAMGLISNSMNGDEFQNIVDKHGATLSAIIHIGHARLTRGLVQKRLKNVPILTGRQKDILAALNDGLRYKEIAHKYSISTNTVAFHMSELRKKFGCSTSREILSEAYRADLLKTL